MASDAPMGLMSFPGIRQVVSGTYTLSHGISPSVAVLSIAPQTAPPAIDGGLTITFGSVGMTFNQCRINTSSFEYDSNGKVLKLCIWDKRWRWKTGKLTGSWNLRWPDGSLNVTTEKTPIQLMELCLAAMDEPNFDLSSVPNFHRPEVHWDYDNPAQALSDLADGAGCHVVLKIDGQVAVIPVGYGKELPQGESIQQASSGFNPPMVPDSLLYVAGPTRYQADILLEAVGLDKDGKWKPLDRLSYRPANGWKKVVPPSFANVLGQGGIPDDKGQTLARDTIYRCYRVAPSPKGSDGKPLRIAGHDKAIESRYEILPLEDEQVDFAIDAGEVVIMKDGQPAAFPVPKNKPPFIWGFWGSKTLSYQTTVPLTQKAGKSLVPSWVEPKAEYKGSFTIDKEEGIVKFSDYVYYFAVGAGGFNIVPAILVLRVACPIRDRVGKVPKRYTREKDMGQRHGTGPRIVRHMETQAAYNPHISPGDNEIAGFTTNIDAPFAQGATAIKVEADYYLDAAAREYQAGTPTEGLYAGIKRIDLDGAIQSVSWSVGVSGGATTRAARNGEGSIVTLPYRDRRAMERLWGDRQQQAQAAAAYARVAYASKGAQRAQQMGG